MVYQWKMTKDELLETDKSRLMKTDQGWTDGDLEASLMLEEKRWISGSL
jgi:hypothetical protein